MKTALLYTYYAVACVTFGHAHRELARDASPGVRNSAPAIALLVSPVWPLYWSIQAWRGGQP